MANQGLTGLARLRAAFLNSKRAAGDLWRGEEAFRLECGLLLIGTPFAFWLGKSWTETALLIGVLILLILVEVLNSAIEAVVDRIGPERHELSRIAKDAGSLAVLLACILAGLVWLAVLADRVTGY